MFFFFFELGFIVDNMKLHDIHAKPTGQSDSLQTLSQRLIATNISLSTFMPPEVDTEIALADLG